MARSASRTGASSGSAGAPSWPAIRRRRSSRCTAPGSRPGWSIATPIWSSAATAPANMSSGSKARPMRRSPAPAAASPRRCKATRAATLEELVEASRPRLRALMRGGVTTVEIKSGYGLDIETELKMLRAARALGESEAVRVETTLLALHALPPEFRGPARGVRPARHRIDAAGRRARRGWRARSTPFAKGSASRPTRSRRCSRRPPPMASASSSMPSSSAICAAPRWRPIMSALSADHLEHADEEGVAAMARAGMVAVLLPGAFYALQGDKEAAGRPAAPLRRADGGGDRLQSRHLAGAVADPDDVDGLHPVRPDPRGGARGHDPQRARRALGLQDETGTISAGKAADLCIWRIGRPAELCYWIGMPGPERRIVAGRMLIVIAASESSGLRTLELRASPSNDGQRRECMHDATIAATSRRRPAPSSPARAGRPKRRCGC